MIDKKIILDAYDKGPEAVLKLFYDTFDSFVKQNTALEFKSKKNSTNSHKPPSSDGLAKPKVSSTREKTEKKQGGQPGHKGHTLHQAETPDIVITNTLDTCPECGGPLEDEPVLKIKKRQVFDIEPVKVEVTQHEIEIKKCKNCRARQQSSFPSTVPYHVQYGENIQVTIIYLMYYQLVPFERTKEFFRDCFGLSISEGTLRNINSKFGDYLAEIFEPEAREAILKADVIHCDETGIRCEGKTQWLHTLSTPNVTLQYIHPNRGTVAINEIGLLPSFEGIVVHDCLASYFVYEQCGHAVCNAHILRDLKGIYEFTKQRWANEMMDILLLVKNADEKERTDPTFISWLKDAYQFTIDNGHEENKMNYNHDAHKLLNRLSKRQDSILLFVENPNVPFDNNMAERDLRMAKVKQKISGSFRSAKGAKDFALARSFIGTLKKQNKDLFEALKEVMQKGTINLFNM